MSDPDDVLRHIDQTLDGSWHDLDVSVDAMRWTPEPLPALRDIPPLPGLPNLRYTTLPPLHTPRGEMFVFTRPDGPDLALTREQIQATVAAFTDLARALREAMVQVAASLTRLHRTLQAAGLIEPSPDQPLTRRRPDGRPARPRQTTPMWVSRMDGRR